MKNLIATVLLVASSMTFAQQKLTVNYEWKISHKCGKKSPEITINGIPSGSTQLDIKMVDLDYKSWDHGGGFLKNDEGFPEIFKIAEGELNRGYDGPCPPNFTSHGHDYEITVIAKDKGNQVLGKGSAVKTFSAKTVKE
jgi:phosphatidylethanolamine-binding protein (PEBP) family uncharacterized protein